LCPIQSRIHPFPNPEPSRVGISGTLGEGGLGTTVRNDSRRGSIGLVACGTLGVPAIRSARVGRGQVGILHHALPPSQNILLSATIAQSSVGFEVRSASASQDMSHLTLFPPGRKRLQHCPPGQFGVSLKVDKPIGDVRVGVISRKPQRGRLTPQTQAERDNFLRYTRSGESETTVTLLSFPSAPFPCQNQR